MLLQKVEKRLFKLSLQLAAASGVSALALVDTLDSQGERRLLLVVLSEVSSL